jgi:hypothetical protein
VAVDQLGAGELLPVFLQVGQHREVVLGELVAPAVARSHGRRIATGLKQVRMLPVGLDQPALGVVRLQHELVKALPRGLIAQLGHPVFDILRQLEPRLGQHHQRHAALVQQVIHHGRQIGAPLGLRQVGQFLEQRLVQPAHQVVGCDAAVRRSPWRSGLHRPGAA